MSWIYPESSEPTWKLLQSSGTQRNGLSSRGAETEERTLAFWVVKLITKAYRMKNMDPPSQVNAHSTRAVSESWAARLIVSLETVCRATTWSSWHTFLKHYRIDPGTLTMVELGRRAVHATVSMPN